jgi:hypothetical protein
VLELGCVPCLSRERVGPTNLGVVMTTVSNDVYLTRKCTYG